MKDDQLAAIRDALIAELATPKSSASKFEGALMDWRERNVKRVDGLFPAADQKTIDLVTANVRTLIKAAHDLAIANLAVELTRPEYAGKTPDEIQKILMQEVVLTAEFEEPTIELTEKVTGSLFVAREVARTPPPIGRVWGGIPYTYNTPPLEVIQQALDARKVG